MCCGWWMAIGVIGYRLGFVLYMFCFFVKQKTAYEMRISDWSSDVCSSDLRERADDEPCSRGIGGKGRGRRGSGGSEPPPNRGREHRRTGDDEIGRASCRERVCKYV